MLENDADRLASIRGLGGQLVRSAMGNFEAIFDAPGSISNFDDTHVDSTSPTLTARTCDVSRLGPNPRGVTVTVTEGSYIVREHQRGSAPGWSVLVLDES
jgi:hypothetical protein